MSEIPLYTEIKGTKLVWNATSQRALAGIANSQIHNLLYYIPAVYFELQTQGCALLHAITYVGHTTAVVV